MGIRRKKSYPLRSGRPSFEDKKRGRHHPGEPWKSIPGFLIPPGIWFAPDTEFQQGKICFLLEGIRIFKAKPDDLRRNPDKPRLSRCRSSPRHFLEDSAGRFEIRRGKSNRTLHLARNSGI
jgi:hypothetical protein